MHDRDSLHRFIFEHYPIRGHLVHLDASWRALIEHRDYPGVIREALGEAVVAIPPARGDHQFEGVLSLQLQGPGASQLLLAQWHERVGRPRTCPLPRGTRIRGTGRGPASSDRHRQSHGDIGKRRWAQRYQGIVPITGPRLGRFAADLLREFRAAADRLWLHADEHGAAGHAAASGWPGERSTSEHRRRRSRGTPAEK